MTMSELPLEYALWDRVVRRAYVVRLLREAGGMQTRAARIANVHRNTINRMIREVGISGQDIRRIKLQTQIRNGAHANV
jgi:hypothetical protein